jgi:cytochrome d ubiquinol oxidase subunit I
MRTAEAVTPVGGLLLPFVFFSLLYLGLGAASVWLLRREVTASPFFPAGEDVADPPDPEGKE